jgi:hypothetical protein
MLVTFATVIAVGATGVPGAPADEMPPPIEATIQKFLVTRNSAVVTSPSAPRVTIDSFDVPLTDVFAATTAANLDKLETMRTKLSGLGERYTSVNTRATVLDVVRNGAVVTARVNELTSLAYEQIHGGEPPVTEYSIDHAIDIVRDGSVWRIASDVVPTDGILPVTMVAAGDPIPDDTPAPSPVYADDAVGILTLQYTSAADCGVTNGCDATDAVSVATKSPPDISFALRYPSDVLPSPDVLKVDTTGIPNVGSDRGTPPTGMNYTRLVNYAYQYWDNYNSSYRSWGVDCTNFISQALQAAGWPEDNGWYKSWQNWWYNSLNQTFTWAGAENWSYFATKRTTNYAYTNQLVPSDILQLDFGKDGNMNHSMIVTSKSGGVPYLTYHTTDTKDRSLTSIEASLSYNSNWYYAYRT